MEVLDENAKENNVLKPEIMSFIAAAKYLAKKKPKEYKYFKGILFKRWFVTPVYSPCGWAIFDSIKRLKNRLDKLDESKKTWLYNNKESEYNVD